MAQGIDLSKGRDQAQLEALRVIDLASPDTAIFSHTATEAAVFQSLKSVGFNQGFLKDPKTDKFMGQIILSDIAGRTGKEVGHKRMPVDLVFSEHTSVFQAMNFLEDFVGDAVPVLDQRNGRLLGVVTEAAIISAYLDMVTNLRREENAAL